MGWVSSLAVGAVRLCVCVFLFSLLVLYYCRFQFYVNWVFFHPDVLFCS